MKLHLFHMPFGTDFFFVKCPIKSLACFYNGLSSLLICRCSILGYQISIYRMRYKYYLPSWGLSIYPLYMVSVEEQNFLILTYSNLAIFFYSFFFKKNTFLLPNDENQVSVTYSKSLIVLPFTFRILIYIESIFACRLFGRGPFSFLFMTQLSQMHLLKRPSFPCRSSLACKAASVTCHFCAYISLRDPPSFCISEWFLSPPFSLKKILQNCC